MVFMLAVSVGLIVANIYYSQPLIGPIARELGMSPQTAGLIATLTQLGYGAGLLLLVPLGDLIENRKLVIGIIGLGMIASLKVASVARSNMAGFTIGIIDCSFLKSHGTIAGCAVWLKTFLT